MPTVRRMAAVRMVEWGRGPELVEVAVPEPGHGQVRVRVAGCGLCHSDLTMASLPREVGGSLGWAIPFTLGHETAGWVDAVGPGADGWAEGTPVALAAASSCGRCRACRRGLESACAHGAAGRGYGRDGGLAEHVLVEDPDRSLLPLGDLDPATAGPLTDAGATSHHAVARVAPRVAEGGAVVVVGAGGLGIVVVQLARVLTGATVLAVDPDPARRDLALRRGAHLVIDVAEPASLRRALAGRPVDAVVDLVGTDDTLSAGLAVLAPGGAFALVGAGGATLQRPWYGGLPRDAEIVTFQGSDLRDARQVIRLAATGALTVDVEPYPLGRALDAFAALDRGGLTGRLVVQPDLPSSPTPPSSPPSRRSVPPG